MRRPDVNENPLGVVVRFVSQVFRAYAVLVVVWLLIVLVVNFPWTAILVILGLVWLFYFRQGPRRR